MTFRVARSRVPARLFYVVGAVLVTIVIAAGLRHSISLLSFKPLGSTKYEHVNSLSNSWHFDTERDANNYGLTSDQCDIAFPGLFKEIDTMVQRRRSKPITKAELTRETWPWGTVRVLVWEQQIYVLETWKHTLRRSRVYSTLHSLNRALMASTDERKLPNIEFIFSIEDWTIAADLPIWAYDRRGSDTNTWLMPDFGFYAWPEPGVGTYSEVRRRMRDVEETTTFADKIPKLVWRGAVTPSVGPTLRQHFLDQTANQTWADVQVLDWKAEDESKRNRIYIEDHCKYQFIQHTAGRAWSGRLKYMQNCNSVIVAHELEWIQHHQHLLVPDGESQNYVLVRRDFSDLREKMRNALQETARTRFETDISRRRRRRAIGADSSEDGAKLRGSPSSIGTMGRARNVTGGVCRLRALLSCGRWSGSRSESESSAGLRKASASSGEVPQLNTAFNGVVQASISDEQTSIPRWRYVNMR